jgi:hypothetical protein
MAVGLLAVLRDEAANLPRFLGLLELLELQSVLSGLFCSFYENDSSDATPTLLARWLQHRPGSLISEQLGEARFRERSSKGSSAWPRRATERWNPCWSAPCSGCW